MNPAFKEKLSKIENSKESDEEIKKDEYGALLPKSLIEFLEKPNILVTLASENEKQSWYEDQIPVIYANLLSWSAILLRVKRIRNENNFD